jgi:hypothetical protein
VRQGIVACTQARTEDVRQANLDATHRLLNRLLHLREQQRVSTAERRALSAEDAAKQGKLAHTADGAPAA